MCVRLIARRASGLLLVVLVGCGTTRMTDSPRAATEMLLMSQAVDHAVAQLDFSVLSEQTVFLDTTSMDKDLTDKGYLISTVRQQLLAHGALLRDEKWQAQFVVELRAGALGTDRQGVMVGTPAVSLPSVVPGIPTSIPEIAFMKKNEQRGVAKIGVFAYNRVTGRAVWQSGLIDATTQEKNTWVLGTGPFTRGTIRKRTELVGQPLPDLSRPGELFDHKNEKELAKVINAAGKEQFFPNHSTPAPPQPLPAALLGVTGGAILANQPLLR